MPVTNVSFNLLDKEANSKQSNFSKFSGCKQSKFNRTIVMDAWLTNIAVETSPILKRTGQDCRDHVLRLLNRIAFQLYIVPTEVKQPLLGQ